MENKQNNMEERFKKFWYEAGKGYEIHDPVLVDILQRASLIFISKELSLLNSRCNEECERRMNEAFKTQEEKEKQKTILSK